MGILAALGASVLLVVGFLVLSIFGLIFVGVGLAAGYFDSGFRNSAIVVGGVYSVFFAIFMLLVMFTTISAKMIPMFALIFLGIPILFFVGLGITLFFNFLGFKAGESIAE